MPVAPLQGLALTTALDLATAHEDGHEAILYLGPERGVLDEAAITSSAWLPGAGWAARADVLLSSGIAVSHDGTARAITFTVADEDRLTWRDDYAVAVVARHWIPSEFRYGGWYLVGWGYLTGEGRARLGLGLDQTSERVVSYVAYWGLSRVPSLRLGRRNLATSASIAGASPHLLTPEAEIPNKEYISQDDCSPQKAIDGTADTVAVANVMADPEPPTLGQTNRPKFLRVGGPFTRGVAAGGEPRFAELWAGYDAFGWNAWPAPEGNASPEIDNNLLRAWVTADRYNIHAKAQPQNQSNSVYVQFDVGVPDDRPLLLSFRVKAGATVNIGSTLVLQLGVGGTNTNHFIKLTGAMERHEFPIDPQPAGSKPIVIRFRADRDELFRNDIRWEIENYPKMWAGWSSTAEPRALFLGMDDGAGHEALVRLTNLNGGDSLNGGPALVIPTFKRKFGDGGGVTMLQMKGTFPWWFFAPGVGRMKLAWGNDPQRTDYDDPSIDTFEQILFNEANGGQPWLPTQSLARQNHIGTGFLVPEQYPQIGLLPAPYDSAYWWLDLGEYDAPTLTAPLAAGGLRLHVSDPDAYTDHGYGTFLPGGERAWWTGKEEDALVFHNSSRRGIDGTVAAAHGAGDRFVPDSFGGVYQNVGTMQRGWNVDLIEIRRKPGTARIRNGVVLISNQVAPGNPSEGGARWERHPDWMLVTRFAEVDSDTLSFSLRDLLGGPTEARHVCVVIDKMDRDRFGKQRAKVNEIVVLEATLGATAAGRWRSPQVGTVGDGIAHVLTRYAGVPPSKVLIRVPTPPVRDLVVSAAMADQVVKALADRAQLRVWTDAANNVVIDADPANPAYTATIPYFVLDTTNVTGEVSLSWAAAHRVGQVRVAGREEGGLRQFTARYPRTSARLGKIEEFRDLLFRTAADVLATAIALFRRGNARRRATATAGALPWLEPHQRILIDLPEIERGGGGTGLNTTVAGYRLAIGLDDGGTTWETSLDLDELAL